ncbi:MAG: RloB family protein, partial [Lachnoclostridium sp.]|nr:RloB family protein [Lachnoclostridium sp.]
IADAEKQGVSTGWSNPCLEIWFHSYLGDMPINSTSTQCINVFEAAFQKQTGQKYDKSDKSIYRKLCKVGDEENAIKTAKFRYQQHYDLLKPSKMLSTTTLYLLIDEIKSKIKSQK